MNILRSDSARKIQELFCTFFSKEWMDQAQASLSEDQDTSKKSLGAFMIDSSPFD